MNHVPGKSGVQVKPAGIRLWLTCLLLPLQVLAQTPATTQQMYYPGIGPVVWPPQPMVQPQVLQQPAVQANTQPAMQPTMQPVIQPGVLPRYPVAPAWNNNQQRPAMPYYPNPYHWGRPGAPAVPGYHQAQTVQATAPAPYLETSIDSNSAHVHQNLVMTVNVISTTAVKTANLDIQDNNDYILRQIGDVIVDSRTRQGKKEVINTVYYLLTPLRSGDIELEPLHITGIMDSGAGYETNYNAVASTPLHLTVSAPHPGVQPWLPLHALALSASLSNDEHIGEGEPLTLTVEQHAEGMSGTQLPSLESQLQAPGHRLYREHTEYEGTITKQGKLLGTRRDRFTLVPQQGSEVEIPALRLDWWNVERQRRETAVLPARVLNAGETGADKESSIDDWLPGNAGTIFLWLGLLPIAFLLGHYWKRLKPALQRSCRVLWQWLDVVSKPAQRQLKVILVHLSPRRNLHLLRRWIANTIPRSSRMWFCVRNADEEQDPDDWSQVLRFLINRRLGLSANLPMSKLADNIIEIHPWADADRIRALLSELEATLFSGHEIQDFKRWKEEFKRQIRPHLFAGLRHRHRTIGTSTLPGLNPGVS
jgi:hypothetical protein